MLRCFNSFFFPYVHAGFGCDVIGTGGCIWKYDGWSGKMIHNDKTVNDVYEIK